MNIYEIKNNTGFSLIELTIVIGVLGILSMIAIPSFLIVIERAADRSVRISLKKSFKECQINLVLDKEIPTFELDMGIVRRNGFYKFYQGFYMFLTGFIGINRYLLVF